MLEMRPNCECCGTHVLPDRPSALICSFECTFCVECAHNVLHGICPNCGGGLTMRPIRDNSLLEKFPASVIVKVKSSGCKASVG